MMKQCRECGEHIPNHVENGLCSACAKSVTAVWTRKMRGGEWGPWHQGRDHHLTLCGRRMRGVTTWRSEPPTEDERRCDKCEKHAAAGTSAAYRKH